MPARGKIDFASVVPGETIGTAADWRIVFTNCPYGFFLGGTSLLNTACCKKSATSSAVLPTVTEWPSVYVFTPRHLKLAIEELVRQKHRPAYLNLYRS